MVPTMVCFAHKHISQSNDVYNGSFCPETPLRGVMSIMVPVFHKLSPEDCFLMASFAHQHSEEEWYAHYSHYPHPLHTTHNSQLAILLWVLVAHHPLTTHCPLLTTNYLLATSDKTFHYQLLTKNFLPSTAPFSLLANILPSY